MLHGDPAVAVQDRLGQPGGARGEQHVERVVERHPGELQRARLGGEVRPGGRALGGRTRPGRGRASRPASRRWAGAARIASTSPRRSIALRAVAVAVDGDQDLRCDLLPAVGHALGAELRRAGAEDRAQAGRGEEHGEGLGDVRAVRRHPVPALDARREQAHPHLARRGRAARSRSAGPRRGPGNARRRRCRGRRGRASAASPRRSSAAPRGTRRHPASQRRPARPSAATSDGTSKNRHTASQNASCSSTDHCHRSA